MPLTHTPRTRRRFVRLDRSWLLGLAAALLITVPAWLPWIDPRLNLLWEEAKGVDDAKNHMLRLYLLQWMAGHGVWYPRWMPDLYMGYGYPMLNFYAPGFYYLALLTGAIFRLDIWDSYRSVGVIAALLGAAGGYALTTAVWRRPALGVLSAILLLYGPYVFQTNLYQRGDLPEALALALVPWLLLGIWQFWQAQTAGRRLAWLALAVTAGASELLVHNLTALMAVAMAACWTAWLFLVRPSRFRLASVAAAGALAAGLTAFFWVPSVIESGNVHLEIAQEGHLDYRQWLLDPAGNTLRQQASENRQSRAGLFDMHLLYPHQHQFTVTLKPSLAQAGLFLLGVASLIVAALRWASVRRQSAGAGTDLALAAPTAPLLLVAAVCWWLTFSASAPLWQHIPGLAMLQYPGRLMGPFGIAMAIGGAGALAAPLAWLERRASRWAASGAFLVVAAAVLINSAGDRHVPLADDPRKPMDGRMVFLEEGDRFSNIGTTSGGEFTPLDVQIATYTAGQPRGRAVYERLYPEADWIGGLFYPLTGDLRLLGWRAGPLRYSLRVANDAAQPGTLGVRQLRFPGWRAWVDGRPEAVLATPYVAEQQAALGFLVLEVPPGEHTINLAFGPSTARLAGLVVTLGTGLLVAAAAVGALCWPAHWMIGRRGRRLAPQSGVALAIVGSLALGYVTWRGVRPAFGRFATPNAAIAVPRDGVWRSDSFGDGESGLIVNLAEAVRNGQARVSSPSGAIIGPDRFVDVRQLTVVDEDHERGQAGVSRRQWLYLHPPSSVSVDVAVPTGRIVWFSAAVSLDPRVWLAPEGDGVRFVASVKPLTASSQSAGAATTTVVDLTFNPRVDAQQRRWVPVEADLSEWAGQSVRLTLSTDPRQDTSFDWAGWANPVVAVREIARDRPITK